MLFSTVEPAVCLGVIPEHVDCAGVDSGEAIGAPFHVLIAS